MVASLQTRGAYKATPEPHSTSISRKKFQGNLLLLAPVVLEQFTGFPETARPPLTLPLPRVSDADPSTSLPPPPTTPPPPPSPTPTQQSPFSRSSSRDAVPPRQPSPLPLVVGHDATTPATTTSSSATAAVAVEETGVSGDEEEDDSGLEQERFSKLPLEEAFTFCLTGKSPPCASAEQDAFFRVSLEGEPSCFSAERPCGASAAAGPSSTSRVQEASTSAT